MNAVKEYLIHIVSAAVICGIATNLIGSKSSNAKLIRLICGLFMSICIISPILEIRIGSLSEYFASFEHDANAAVAYGNNQANKELTAIIKENTEAYILDKATALGLMIDVEVTVSDTSPPVPCQVAVTGTVAPFQKVQLQNWIAENLCIAQEHQVWE